MWKYLLIFIIRSSLVGFESAIFRFSSLTTWLHLTTHFLFSLSQEDYGLIPRICEGLFHHISGVLQKDKASFHMEVRYERDMSR